MPNVQQISQHGAIDLDGNPVSGVHRPGFGPMWPGIGDWWADANTDAYASALISPPMAKNWAGQAVAFAATDTSDTVSINGLAGARVFVAGYYYSLSSFPAAAIAHVLNFGATLAFNFAFDILVPTSGGPVVIFQQFPVPLPAAALNAGVTLTLTAVGGGTLNCGGRFGIFGYARTE